MPSQPCTLIIFGATGDLTHRKLIPALYNLWIDGNLSSALTILGFARREKSNEQFRSELKETAEKFSRQKIDRARWERFASSIYYSRGAFGDPEQYTSLSKALDMLDAQRETRGNRLFYLAAAPEQFEVILENLRMSKLNTTRANGWTRVVIEKPFGTDLLSAQRLNSLVERVCPEHSTYRIDHYLGKETAQNIMVLRFANALFEAVWNARYIHHVQITASETIGVEGRAGYYEQAGALRDIVQNHLLQLLCLIAMEPPIDLGADSIRDEKVKVLRSLRPIIGDEVPLYVVRAQYTAGTISGQEALAYREEHGVSPQSCTETFVALHVNIDNWRWAGVPFFIRVGKRLPKRRTEIAVHFKSVPHILFKKATQEVEENVLAICIQPDEGVFLQVSAKLPGSTVRIQPVKMNFHYGTSFGRATPEAYERLLLDAINGDASLFARRDEVEEAWRFVDGIRSHWNTFSAKDIAFYPAGSWGSPEADRLTEAYGAKWRCL
ncbi:MAG: glucose-6-phosphate dehydrogenase [Candidatus Xiphinematobacter sp.]|nr:MAG: glucose-6-phosphate dehydrogenase [Candidatus Xiphinematobacter sp.]